MARDVRSENRRDTVCQGERVMPTTSANAGPRESLAGDIIWSVKGKDGIASFLGLPPHKVYYLIARGQIPVRKLGHKIICASRAELSRAFGAEAV